MRNSLFASVLMALSCCVAWPADAQTPDPTLLRITFVAATPTVSPEMTPTDPLPGATPTVVLPEMTPTVVPTQPTTPAVPEPSTFALVSLGAAALACIVRRIRRKGKMSS